MAKFAKEVRQTIMIVYTAFTRHGLKLNFKRGKSAIIIKLRGKGAVRLRTEIWGQGAVPLLR